MSELPKWPLCENCEFLDTPYGMCNGLVPDDCPKEKWRREFVAQLEALKNTKSGQEIHDFIDLHPDYQCIKLQKWIKLEEVLEALR